MTFDPNVEELTDEEYIAKTFADLDQIYGENNEPEDDALGGGEGQLQGGPSDEEVSQEIGQTGQTGGEGDEHGVGEDAGGAAPDGSKTVTLPNGQVSTLEELQRYYDFEQFLQTHPDVAQRVVQAAQGQTIQPPVETPPAPPALPEDVDLEDPTTRFLYEQNIANQRSLQAIAAQQQEAQQATAIQHANIAIRQTQDRLHLSDADLGKLRVATAELNIVPSFISRNPSNPISAMEQALEFTFWSQPEFRDAAIQARVDAELAATSADTRRQRNLNKVSNASGGSKPPPARKEPATEDERREAMIQEISEAMGR
jgi:hypothetical protein